MTDPAHLLRLIKNCLDDYQKNGRLCETSTVPLLRDHVWPALEEMKKMQEKQIGIEMAQKHLRDLVDCMEGIQ